MSGIYTVKGTKEVVVVHRGETFPICKAENEVAAWDIVEALRIVSERPISEVERNAVELMRPMDDYNRPSLVLFELIDRAYPRPQPEAEEKANEGEREELARKPYNPPETLVKASSVPGASKKTTRKKNPKRSKFRKGTEKSPNV
jgi:hypothetical protein